MGQVSLPRSRLIFVAVSSEDVPIVYNLGLYISTVQDERF